MKLLLKCSLLILLFSLLACGNDPAGVTIADCSDGIQNQGETGVDCGGPCEDCMTCNDGILNQDEEEIDCGGICPACPTCDDGIQNQDETGVDCGGNDCPICYTPPACTVMENMANYEGLPSLDVYGISCNNNGNNRVVANANNGDIRIEFREDEFPTGNSIYTISNDCPTSFLNSGECCLSTVTGGTFSSNFVAQGGQVNVYLENDQLHFVFCDILFQGSAPFDFKGSAHLVCD